MGTKDTAAIFTTTQISPIRAGEIGWMWATFYDIVSIWGPSGDTWTEVKRYPQVEEKDGNEGWVLACRFGARIAAETGLGSYAVEWQDGVPVHQHIIPFVFDQSPSSGFALILRKSDLTYGGPGPSLDWHGILDQYSGCQPNVYNDLTGLGLWLLDPNGNLKGSNPLGGQMLKRLASNGFDHAEVLKAMCYHQVVRDHCAVECTRALGQFQVSASAIPLFAGPDFAGVMLLVEDTTRLRKKEKEILGKSAVIREIHHRVKNNLQTITSLLRLQMRRVRSRHLEKILNETVHRILSIALIHESLSRDGLESIEIQRTIESIMEMVLENMVPPNKKILGEVTGEEVYLDAGQASYVALCVTELIQNAVEHAFPYRSSGMVRVTVKQSEHNVIVTVEDNGVGISPARKDSHSLGLRIVETISKSNLQGTFLIEGHRYGTIGTLTFPLDDPSGSEMVETSPNNGG